MLLLLGTILTSQASIQEQSQSIPVPRVDSSGRALTFTFPGMRIGTAEYEEGPTGTTVFYFPNRVKAAVDVRGGAPGTMLTDALRLGYESRLIEAVVFSGGSANGLSAATGAANELKVMHAEQGETQAIVGVVGAIINDMGNRRFDQVTPDDRLGRSAVRSAREGWFPLGARGAGRFAMQGGFFVPNRTADGISAWKHSGQGGAFWENGPTKIAVFAVINAAGTIVSRDGSVPRCRRNAETTPCPLIASLMRDKINGMVPRRGGAPSDEDDVAPGLTSNTTITLVVTNRKLASSELQRLAVQVHTSMARAIQPFATQGDGDVLYAVTTDEVDDSLLALRDFATIASEVAWDAVLSSVPDLPAAPPQQPLTINPSALREFVETFEFASSDTLVITAESARLEAHFSGHGRIYFDEGRSYNLIPVGRDLFVVDAPARDVVHFDRESGRIAGFTLNPGPWSQRARKKRAS